MPLAAVKYFDNDFSSMNDSQKFIELLYHNEHNSFAYRNMKISGFMTQSACLNKSAILSRSLPTTYDTWISLNLFKSSTSRASSNCRELTGFYFDLDKHDGSVKQIRNAVIKSSALLYELVDKKILPKPTIITNTGRGLGVYYIFERTLAVTDSTSKQQKLYTYLYSKLADIFADHFNSSDLLEVDHVVVNDITRIVRLPGTYNSSARKFCSIQFIGGNNFGHVQYYNMSDFKPYIKKYDDLHIKEIKVAAKSMPVISFTGCTSTFLFNRVSQMYKLQSHFNLECTNKRREFMCFIFYNSAKQIYSNAVDLLQEFNQRFLCPLDPKEVEHVIDSVDRSVATSHSGFYKLSDTWIINKLDLNQEELDLTMIGQSQRKLIREAAKEKTKNKRLERDQKIITLLTDISLTYEEISNQVGVSISTVKRVAKSNAISRYNVSEVENTPDLSNEITSDSEVPIFVPVIFNSLFKLLILHHFICCFEKVHFLSQSLYVVLVAPLGDSLCTISTVVYPIFRARASPLAGLWLSISITVFTIATDWFKTGVNGESTIDVLCGTDALIVWTIVFNFYLG